MTVMFTLVPASGKHTTKKNSQVIRKSGSRMFIAQNDKCVASQHDLHRQARDVFGSNRAFGLDDKSAYALDMTFVFEIPKSRKDVVVGEPMRQRPDVGNLAALVSDAMEGILYTDDCQVVEETVRKVWGKRCEIIVSLSRVDA